MSHWVPVWDLDGGLSYSSVLKPLLCCFGSLLHMHISEVNIRLVWVHSGIHRLKNSPSFPSAVTSPASKELLSQSSDYKIAISLRVLVSPYYCVLPITGA